MSVSHLPIPEPFAAPRLERAEAERLDREFEKAPAEEILAWAAKTFAPKFAVTSSFGASSGAMLHMLAEVAPEVPVIFLETGFHFDKTLRFRDLLAQRYGLTVESWSGRGGRRVFDKTYPEDIRARETIEGLARPDGAPGKLQTGIDLCCWVNKVEPLQRALAGRLAYATSLRRDGGTEQRSRTRIIEYAEPTATRNVPMVKVNPMANWTKRDLWRYIHVNEVPIHELFLEGYKSIGCAPCTAPVGEGGDERSGRWSGSKVECGIHTIMEPKGQINYEI